MSFNAIDVKNRIKRIIKSHSESEDPNDQTYITQIANYIFHASYPMVDALQIAKTELKSPNLYSKLEDILAMMIAENIYRIKSD